MKTRADYEKVERRIRAMFKKWRAILALDHWSITLSFDYAEYPENGADCTAQPEYYQAQIVVHLVKLLKDYPEAHQWEDMIVHELVHALSWSSNETEVTRLTTAILRAHDYNLAKKPTRDFK